MPASSPSVRIAQGTNICRSFLGECALLLPALISDRSDGITPLPRVCAACAQAHVRAARWTFLAHASSKHSPEHHPSSALIDATVSHARQRSWSGLQPRIQKKYRIVPARHPAYRLFESGQASDRQIRQPATSLSLLAFTFSATPSPVASARVLL
jgi:hypothetical protein